MNSDVANNKNIKVFSFNNPKPLTTYINPSKMVLLGGLDGNSSSRTKRAAQTRLFWQQQNNDASLPRRRRCQKVVL